MKNLKQTLKRRMPLSLRISLHILISLILISAIQLNAQTVRIIQKQESLSATQVKVQQIYTTQIGIREKQPNSGSAVDQYLRYVNLPKGNPWCAAFVCWVYGKAGVGNPKTGWSPDLFWERRVIWESGVPARYPISLTTNNEHRTTPSTGDIFGLYFPEKGRIAHVGFIDKWDGTWLITVEGNTNISGSREGDGVYRKKRLVRSIYMVARYVDASRPKPTSK